MSTFDAVGMNAVGTSSNIGTTSADLGCIVTAFSALTANLTAASRLAASVSAAAAVTASLTAGGARMSANLQAISHLNADITAAQAAPTFTPSAARTIFVNASSPVFTGGKWWNLTDTKKPRGLKDPDATIDLTFDWSDWLNDIGSAVISDATFTLNGLSSVGTFFDGNKTTVFVSGGTAGSSAAVSCMIKTYTNPPRTDQRTVYIDIAEE